MSQNNCRSGPSSRPTAPAVAESLARPRRPELQCAPADTELPSPSPSFLFCAPALVAAPPPGCLPISIHFAMHIWSLRLSVTACNGRKPSRCRIILRSYSLFAARALANNSQDDQRFLLPPTWYVTSLRSRSATLTGLQAVLRVTFTSYRPYANNAPYLESSPLILLRRSS